MIQPRLWYYGSNCVTRGGACKDAADVAVLSAPFAPWTGAPLRVIVAAEKPLDGELSLIVVASAAA